MDIFYQIWFKCMDMMCLVSQHSLTFTSSTGRQVMWSEPKVWVHCLVLSAVNIKNLLPNFYSVNASETTPFIYYTYLLILHGAGDSCSSHWCRRVYPGHVASILQGWHRDRQPFTPASNLDIPVHLTWMSLDCEGNPCKQTGISCLLDSNWNVRRQS